MKREIEGVGALKGGCVSLSLLALFLCLSLSVCMCVFYCPLRWTECKSICPEIGCLFLFMHFCSISTRDNSKTDHQAEPRSVRFMRLGYPSVPFAFCLHKVHTKSPITRRSCLWISDCWR